MFWSMKFLSLFFIVFSVAQGLIGSSLLSLWFFLELSTISFLSGLASSPKAYTQKYVMKIFLLQAFSGMLLLTCILIADYLWHSSVCVFSLILVSLKMGAVPFHSWLLGVSQSLSWDSLFLFLTVLKIIPFMFLAIIPSNFSSLFGVVAFIVASISGALCFNMKILVVWSSLYFMGMLFMTLTLGSLWLELIFLYSLIFLPLPLIFALAQESLSLGSQLLKSGGLSGSLVLIILFNMSGLPPFPGFFMKVMWLIESELDFISYLIFVASSGFIVYMYLSFAVSSLSGSTGQFFYSMKPSRVGQSLAILVILFTPTLFSWIILLPDLEVA